MLELVLIVHQVQRFGCFSQIAKQFVAGDARQALTAAFFEAIPKIAVGQLHDDDELAVDDVVPFKRKDVRVADGLDPAQCLELLLGAHTVFAGFLKIAKDKLDCLEETARRFRLPHLAESTATDPFDKSVASNRFGLRLDPDRHEYIPVKWVENRPSVATEMTTARGVRMPPSLPLYPSSLRAGSQIAPSRFLPGH